MPTKITRFLHDSLPTGEQVLGTGFALADVHVHDANEYLPLFKSAATNFRGIVAGIHIRVTGDAAASKVTIRVCADAAGDFTLVPDTQADLVAGLTTAADKCAAFRVDIPLFQILGGPGNGSLYLFAHVDAGTPVMAQSCITWME